MAGTRVDERFDSKGNRRNMRCFACFKAGSDAELDQCTCGARIHEDDLCYRGCACTLTEQTDRQAWRIAEGLVSAA
jgi:hypothetical protein